MKIRFKKGILIATISIVMVLLTVITSFALSFDYTGTGSSTTGGSGNLSNTSFSINTTDIDKLVIGYRFSVADKDGKIVGNSYDVYNNSWSRYGIKYDNYYAAKGQNSKRAWIDKTATGFNNNSKVSALGYKKCASSSIDSTMPQQPSKIGGWLSKNSYNNAKTLFHNCGRKTIQNGDRLIVEPLIQTKLDGYYCVNTPTELAVIGGKIYGYNTNVSPKPGTFSTLNNYVQMKFPNQLRTNSAQSKLWGAAPYLSSRAFYSTVINNGYGVSIVNATEDSGIVTEQKYTVKYNANGGTGTMADSTATYGKDFMTRKNTFKREYYKFIGWNEKADGSGTKWNASTPGTYENGKPWKWTYTKNITLYAQWDTVDIYYHTNGGTISGNTYSQKNGWITNKSNGNYFIKKWAVSRNQYLQTTGSGGNNVIFYNASDFQMSRPGYMFVGWSTNEACDYGKYGSNKTFKTYQANVNITDVPLKANKNGEIWLYAVWAPITVTHDVNVDSIYPDLKNFPVNYFTTYANSKGEGSLGSVSYKHNINTSELTLSGTSTNNTQGTFAYQYNTIKPGDTYYITLIYREGNYSGANPYFIIDTGDALGKYSTRNKVDVPLPSKSNPIVQRSITIAKDRSSWVFWLWANGKTTYENYKVEVYVTSGNYVTDTTKLSHGVLDNNGTYLHAYTKTTTDVKGNEYNYLALPAAQNIYNKSTYVLPSNFKTHPFAYHYSSWNAKKDGSGSKLTSSMSIGSANHTIHAQYIPNTVNVQYDAGASDAIIPQGNFNINYAEKTNIITTNGKNFIETYKYDNGIEIKTDSHFSLIRSGYKFAGWMNPATKEIFTYPENGTYKNTTSTVSDMFGYLLDTNGTTITLVAQWIPNTYTVEFWTDIGFNGKYKDTVTSSYSSTTEVNPFRNNGNTLYFESNDFIRASGDTDKMTMKFNETKNLIENKYKFKYHVFNGWYAYSEKANAYYVVDPNDVTKGYWKNVENITENDSLFMFEDANKIVGLSPIDGDVVRMFATGEYGLTDPTPIIPPEPEPWEPYNYKIVYCGNTADSYDENIYKNDISSEKCPINKTTEYVYKGQSTIKVDIDNALTFESSDKKTPIFMLPFNENKSFDLVKTGFKKTGYHYLSNKTWIASCEDTFYGTNKNGEYGWYNSSEINEYYYFSDEQSKLVNLYTDKNNATIYMHAVWEPNTYKVYYCGNGANGQTYGRIGVPDANGSVFAYNHPSTSCPNSSNSDCQYGNYYDETLWQYDTAKKLVANKFTRTGYTFTGWHAYNANTDKWYGYSSRTGELGWYKKGDIKEYYEFKNEASVTNLSSSLNGIIYMTAQWTPIPYYLEYSANGGSGSMEPGALSLTLSGYKENTTLYYDNEYCFRLNAFNYGTRDFSCWRLSNESNQWYGYKDNIIGWYPLLDFTNEKADYVEFKDGDKFENLTVKYGETITAHAQWVDTTKVYYNTNATDANVGNGYTVKGGDIYEKTGLIGLNSNKYTQTFLTNNLDTRPGYGLSTNVSIHSNEFFSLEKTGYTFVGWNSEKNGNGISYPTDTTVGLIRDGSTTNTTSLGMSETTLYAQWEKNTYKVYYCGNGADSYTYTSNVIKGSTENHTCVNFNYCDDTEYQFDTSFQLKSNQFIREGYTFVGWSKVPNPGKDDTIYPDTATVKNLSSLNGDIVYLYAQWVPTRFYYNANYNKLSTQVGDGYTLNSKDDVCDIAGNRICYNFVGSEITIYGPEEFALGIEKHGFVGWSKDKTGTNILVPGTYPTQEVLAYFGTFTDKEVPLYAIWSERDVSFSYNVGTTEVNGTLSLVFGIDNNGFITSNGQIHKDNIYNPTESSTTSLRSISDFNLYMKTDKVFDGWVARRNIDGVDKYLDENKNWVEYTETNIVNNKPYLFRDNEVIQYGSNSIGFADLFGEDLYVDNSNVCFYAEWIQPLDYVVNIKYNVNLSGLDGLNVGNSLSVDNNGFICNKGSSTVYTETFYLPDATDSTLSSMPIFIKSVGNTGFDISYDYHKFIDWNGVTSGEKVLVDLMSDKNKSDLETNKTVDIILSASWKENVLTIRYNTSGGNSSYPLDEKNNVLKNDGSNKILQDKYNALSNDVVIINCDADLGYNKTGNILSGYIINGQKYPLTVTNEKHTAVSFAPELKDDDAIVTVFADWKPNVVNIIYNANTGIINEGNYYVDTVNSHISINDKVFNQTVEYNESANILYNDYFSLIHNTCEFIGWNTAIDGSGTSFTPGESYAMFEYVDNINIPSQDIVLYAQWKPDTYNIYYCGNGADGEGYTNYLNALKDGDADYGSVFDKNSFGDHNCGNNVCNSIGNFYHNKKWEYNKSDKLFENLFTKTGYEFAGYWVDEYGNQYADASLVENLPVDENGVAFLYAQWTPISYIIEYDGNEATLGMVPEQELVYNQVDKLNSNVFSKDYYHSNPDICWIASREINGITHYCTSYDKNTFKSVWTPEDSIDINTDAYKFKENEEVKNLSSIDGDIITMHAMWEPNTLTIIYNTNGGDVSSDGFAIDSNEFINTINPNEVYKHIYVYDKDNTSVNIKNSNFFGMVRESDTDLYFIFNGWALDKTAYVPDYTNKNLYGVSVEQLAPGLKYENVEIKLYAIWNEIDEIVLSYYEGEFVNNETLVNDFKSVVPFPDAYFEVGTADGAPFIYPATVNGFKPTAADYKNYDVDGLYTYFEKLNKDEVVKITHPFYPNVSDNDKYLFFYIDIIYNNIPEITACDRWYTLEEALAGKITKQDLLKTAIAEDVESGNINHLLDIVNFESYAFNKVGDYEITYTVTDDIPAKGQNKTNTKTITVHIVDSYANEKVRFISDDYYPLMSNIYVDENGNYRAKKVNGILYYVDSNKELCLDANGNAYPVDAGLTAKTLINADGSYTVIPLSKWYRNNECVTSLQNCLANNKDEFGNWAHVEEIWTFSADEIKAIKENLKNNIYDENFYTNQYINGHCISITNKSAISQSYDVGQNQINFLNINSSVVQGFNSDEDIDAWNDTFDGYLIIPQTVTESIDKDNTVITNVNVIASNAFANNNSIKTVRIPSTITEIESEAFSDCPNLKTVYIEAKEEDITIYENSFDSDVVIKYIK